MSAYATRSELGSLSALPALMFSGIASADQDAALASASRWADSYLASQYTLPLTAYGDDLKQAVCDIAAFRLASRVGYSPEGANDDVRQRYEDAIRWLEMIARGIATLTDAADSAPSIDFGEARVLGPEPRGW